MRALAAISSPGATPSDSIAGLARPYAVGMRGWRRRRTGQLGSEADRATFRTLHTASLASPALREGLTPDSAERSVRHLRALLGTAAVALTDLEQVLAYDGAATTTRGQCVGLAARALEIGERGGDPAGRPALPGPGDCHLATPSPARSSSRTGPSARCWRSPIAPSAGLLRATDEVARWVSGQLELAELDDSRHRLMEAEVRALRAQISPHFIYNSLGAIASFVRTDPERARELLLEFADFTRYSFRQHGEFTTLAEELRSIERYLLLEQARFGDRLQVTLQIAPEVLQVSIPFLCLQPLVENAVRHGLERASDGGHIQIIARDADRECVISVEDDGAGEDPERMRSVLAGRVHHRLGRPRQRGRAAAQHLRRRLRSGRGDSTRRRHQGDRAGAQVRPGSPRMMPLRGLWSSTTRSRPWTSSPACSTETRGSARSTPPPRRPRRCKLLQQKEVDVVFLDIQMPGLNGIELAQVLGRFKRPPAAVFVTAHEEHALEAFDLRAVDYVLKPVREERLAEAVRRVVEGNRPGPEGRPDRRRARRGHPVRVPLGDPLRRGRGRLRPAAHRRRRATWSGSR